MANRPPKPCSSLSSIQSLVFNYPTYSRSNLEQYQKYLLEHLNYHTYYMDADKGMDADTEKSYHSYRINRTLHIAERIEVLLERLTNPPETIVDVVNQLTPINENQCYTMRSLIKEDLKERETIQVMTYEKNTITVRKVANVEGTFVVTGVVGKLYEVKLYKQGTCDKGSFWCNCPEHKFKSKKKDIVCKHICHIVCEFAELRGFPVIEYFKTKQLTPEQFDVIVGKAESLALA